MPFAKCSIQPTQAAALWLMAYLVLTFSDVSISAQCLEATVALNDENTTLWNALPAATQDCNDEPGTNGQAHVCTIDYAYADTRAYEVQCAALDGVPLKYDVIISCTNGTISEDLIFLGSPVCYPTSSCSGNADEAQDFYETQFAVPDAECTTTVTAVAGESGGSANGGTTNGGSAAGSSGGTGTAKSAATVDWNQGSAFAAMIALTVLVATSIYVG